MSGHLISFVELQPSGLAVSDTKFGATENLGDAFRQAFKDMNDDDKQNKSGEPDPKFQTIAFYPAEASSLTIESPRGSIHVSTETSISVSNAAEINLAPSESLTSSGLAASLSDGAENTGGLVPPTRETEIHSIGKTADAPLKFEAEPRGFEIHSPANLRLTESTQAPNPASSASLAATEALPTNSLTPSQPGNALRPSNVPLPATMPFPQSAAAVLTPQTSDTSTPANTPDITAQPSLSAGTAVQTNLTQQNDPSFTHIAHQSTSASLADGNLTELSVAPSQTGTAHRPSHVHLPADSPFPQSAAAALTSNPAASKASPDAEAISVSRISDANTGQLGGGVSSDLTPVSSQPGPALRPSPVHIPAVTPAPQSAATILTAQVADIPNILSESLAAEDGTKQVKIQLDPPELGRVSIDFKFDGNVLQNVVVTGETPEAMRRLRLMHFELMQTLENYGFSGQDLDFSQREDAQHSFTNADTYYEEAMNSASDDQEFIAEPSTTMAATKMEKAEGLNLKL